MPVDEPTFQELLSSARGGDMAALNLLLDRYWLSLRSLVERRFNARPGRGVELSDVMQETAIYVSERIEQFVGETEKEWFAWLGQVFDHRLIDGLRKGQAKKRDRRRETAMDATLGDVAASLRNQLAAPHSSPSQQANRNEQIKLAIAAVPQPYREVVRLRNIEGHTLEEIATLLECTAADAAIYLDRGLRALRRHLRQES